MLKSVGFSATQYTDIFDRNRVISSHYFDVLKDNNNDENMYCNINIIDCAFKQPLRLTRFVDFLPHSLNRRLNETHHYWYSLNIVSNTGIMSVHNIKKMCNKGLIIYRHFNVENVTYIFVCVCVCTFLCVILVTFR